MCTVLVPSKLLTIQYIKCFMLTIFTVCFYSLFSSDLFQFRALSHHCFFYLLLLLLLLMFIHCDLMIFGIYYLLIVVHHICVLYCFVCVSTFDDFQRLAITRVVYVLIFVFFSLLRWLSSKHSRAHFSSSLFFLCLILFWLIFSTVVPFLYFCFCLVAFEFLFTFHFNSMSVCV